MAKRVRWTKLDPSRTKTERQRFMREIQRRMKALVKSIIQLVVVDDAFGMEPKKQLTLAQTAARLGDQVREEAEIMIETGCSSTTAKSLRLWRNRIDSSNWQQHFLTAEERVELDKVQSQVAAKPPGTLELHLINLVKNATQDKQIITVDKAVVDMLHNAGLIGYNAEKRQYQFLTAPQKVRQFRQWLQQQIDAGLLQTTGGTQGKPWTAEYIESAWRKGMMRAYTDVRKQDLSRTPEYYRGTKEEWLRSSFLQPEMMSKVELLATRAFEGMKGVTEQMSTQMSRLLADGLANGWGPAKVAKQMTDSISSLTRTRALTIARTEIIHAHAEGQLDGFQKLGIEQVGAEVEWSTAGDALVCPNCAPMEGKVFTIQEARGQIPLHPNCRCSWKPVVGKSKKKARK